MASALVMKTSSFFFALLALMRRFLVVMTDGIYDAGTRTWDERGCAVLAEQAGRAPWCVVFWCHQ